MKRTYIIVIIVILIAAGAFFYYQNQQQSKLIDYVEVRERNVIESLRASGLVTPNKTIELSSTIAENVECINYKEGERIKKGQTILAFDDDLALAEYEQSLAQLKSAEASFEQIKASIKEAQAQINLAQIRLENAQKLNDESLQAEIQQAELEINNDLKELKRREYLYQNNAIEEKRVEEQQHTVDILQSKKAVLEQKLVELKKNRNNLVKEASEELKRAELSYQTSQKQYHVAQENINSARAVLNRSQEQLSRYMIKAPIDGIVLGNYVEEGEYIQPGMTLFTLGTEQLQIIISPDEKELNQISIGKKGYVSSDAYPNQKFEVEIFKIAPNIDADRGTIDVYLKPLESNDVLIPNMSVSVEIISKEQKNIKLIPKNYILEDNKTSYVYVYDNGNARRQNIIIEKNYNNQVIIDQGLSTGNKVLNPNGISDGQSVLIGE